MHMMQMNEAHAPPPPLQYNQYASMMKRLKLMNPLGLPKIPGMEGRYAQRRRRRLRLIDYNDDNEYYKYKSISKCIFESNYQVCIEFDWENDIGSVDAMVYNKKVLKSKKTMNDSIAYKDFDDNHIEYYLVYEFDFIFDNHNFNETEQDCHYFNNNDDRICVIKAGTDIILTYFVNDYDDDSIGQTFNYNIDGEWDEIYTGYNNKKCIGLLINTLCLIENNVNDYKLEIKTAITYFEKFEH